MIKTDGTWKKSRLEIAEWLMETFVDFTNCKYITLKVLFCVGQKHIKSRFPCVGCLSAGFPVLQQAWHDGGGSTGHNFPFPRCGQNTGSVTHKHPKISIGALRPVTGDPTDTRKHKLGSARKNNWNPWSSSSPRVKTGLVDGGSRLIKRAGGH